MFSLKNQPSKINNVNGRPEKHGDEKKLAADLKIEIEVANDVLSEFHPALRSALYQKSDAAQGELLDKGDNLTALRFPILGSLSWDVEMKDYTMIMHYGIGGSDLTMIECTVDKFRFTPKDGGTVSVVFRVIIHPQATELGRVFDLSLQKTVDISLIPPDEQKGQGQLAA